MAPAESTSNVRASKLAVAPADFTLASQGAQPQGPRFRVRAPSIGGNLFVAVRRTRTLAHTPLQNLRIQNPTHEQHPVLHCLCTTAETATMPNARQHSSAQVLKQPQRINRQQASDSFVGGRAFALGVCRARLGEATAGSQWRSSWSCVLDGQVEH